MPLAIVLPMTILLSDARSAMYGLRRGGIGLAKFGIGQSQPSGAPSLPAQCSAIHKCWKCMHYACSATASAEWTCQSACPFVCSSV